MISPGGVDEPNSTMRIPALSMLAAQLAECFDVTVYSLSTWQPEKRTAKCGRATVKFQPVYHADHLVTKSRALIRAFSADHQREPYHIVHGLWGVPCGLVAVYLAKRFRIPSVVTLLGAETAYLPNIDYGNMRHPIIRGLTKWVCRNASTLVVISRRQAVDLKKCGIMRDDVSVIPLGTDTTIFRTRRNGFLGEPVRFIHVANLLPVKNQSMLLKAFTRISRSIDSELRIIGQDYLKGRVHRLAREFGLNDKVEFLGYLPHEQLPQQYAWADLMLHTSHHEAGGVVIAEAAACGVVPCGTDVGLLADLASEGCALAVPSNDDRTLADAVIDLIHDEGRFFEMRARTMEWATSHDILWTAGKTRDLFLQTLMANPH